MRTVKCTQPKHACTLVKLELLLQKVLFLFLSNIFFVLLDQYRFAMQLRFEINHQPTRAGVVF